MRRVVPFLILFLVACAPQSPIVEKQVYQTYFPSISKPATKRGMANTGGNCSLLKQFGGWFYVYGTQPSLCDGMESVPMIYNREYVGQPLGGNSEWVLGFNEPELLGISPSEGARLWRQVEADYPEVLLVAPAPVGQKLSNPVHGAIGIDWLREFWDDYNSLYAQPPRLDAIAVHTYFETARDGIDLVGAYETEPRWAGIPIWVTEFGTPYVCPANCLDELKTFLAFLEHDSSVMRYSIFASCIPSNSSWYPPNWTNISLLDPETCTGLTRYGMIYSQ